MFNSKRIETIRKNIQVSTLLSDHEKSDWLNLLELMNDKQLGELEEILAAEPPASQSATSTAIASAPSRPATPAPNMPPLSHIANMPTDVDMKHSTPPNTARQTMPVKPISQTQRPSQPLRPLTARSTPSPNLSTLKPATPTEIAAPSATPAVEPPPLPPVAAPVRPAPQTMPTPQGTYTLEDPAELQHLSIDIIRTCSPQSISNEVKKAISEVGYFGVLQYIEQSPLYKEYINAGKQLLGAPQAQSTLTQAEFEYMTDLLRHMRFNMW